MGGEDNYFYEPLGGQLENHASLPGTALGTYSFLLFIFTPKLYFILLHPAKNTADFVKTAVTLNTMKRSFEARSLPGIDWVVTAAEHSKSSQSETLATTLSTNVVPASVAKNKSENSKRQVPRTVTRDTVT